MKTTLQTLLGHNPCGQDFLFCPAPTRYGYLKLKHHLGDNFPDCREFSLLEVLNSNGLDDTIWCFRAVEGHSAKMREFSLLCVQKTQSLVGKSASRGAAHLLTATDAAFSAYMIARICRRLLPDFMPQFQEDTLREILNVLETEEV